MKKILLTLSCCIALTALVSGTFQSSPIEAASADNYLVRGGNPAFSIDGRNTTVTYETTTTTTTTTRTSANELENSY